MSRTDERPMIYTFIHIERSDSSMEVIAHYCVRNGNGFRRATREDWENAGGHGAAARSKVVICRIKRRP